MLKKFDQCIKSVYYSADVIHSKQTSDEQIQIIQQLKNGSLDCIIQVQILGEGFDHPKLSCGGNFSAISKSCSLYSICR